MAGGKKEYKINLLQPNVKKNVFGWFVYIPQKNRLDLYLCRKLLRAGISMEEQEIGLC